MNWGNDTPSSDQPSWYYRERMFMQTGMTSNWSHVEFSWRESFHHRSCSSKPKSLRGQIISAARADALYNAVGTEPPDQQEARSPSPKGHWWPPTETFLPDLHAGQSYPSETGSCEARLVHSKGGHPGSLSQWKDSFTQGTYRSM